MRLNDGLPVWHASISLQHRKLGYLDDPAAAEAYAVEALAGVGGDREWWYWNPATHLGGAVGHLRVDVTAAEAAMIPPGLAVHDAGESGLERKRTRRGGSR